MTTTLLPSISPDLRPHALLHIHLVSLVAPSRHLDSTSRAQMPRDTRNSQKTAEVDSAQPDTVGTNGGAGSVVGNPTVNASSSTGATGTKPVRNAGTRIMPLLMASPFY